MPQRSIAVGRAFSLITKACSLPLSLKLKRKRVPHRPALHHLFRAQIGLEPWFCLPLARPELSGQVVVIENPMDSKCAIAKLLHDARNRARTFDP